MVQFRFILVQFFGEIRGGVGTIVEGFPPTVPFIKAAADTGVSPRGSGYDPALRNPKQFSCLHQFGTGFAGRFQLAFDHLDLCLTMFIHAPAVQTNIQDIEGSIGGMELEILLHLHEVHS